MRTILEVDMHTQFDQAAALDAVDGPVTRSQCRDARDHRRRIHQVVDVKARLEGLGPGPEDLPEAHIQLIEIRQACRPRGSTMMAVVPCVSATVLFPTETSVVSGNPLWCWRVPLMEIAHGRS